jgi:hypothetical protein
MIGRKDYRMHRRGVPWRYVQCRLLFKDELLEQCVHCSGGTTGMTLCGTYTYM